MPPVHATDRFTFRLDTIAHQAIALNEGLFVRETGLSILEIRMLRMIDDDPGTTFVEIGQRIAVERTKVSRILQKLLANFKLVPFAVGHASDEEVAQVLDLLWGGAETLIVISSDLSHFHPYQEAQRLDGATAGDILALRRLQNHEQACGATPVNGLLLQARQRGMGARLLDLRNSGDTAGDRSRVVGYGAFAFAEAATA